MARLRFGIKPGVGPVVKAMVNDADDPFTTPISQVHKYAFDSEREGLGYIVGDVNVQVDFGHFPENLSANTDYWLYYPTGSEATAHLEMWIRRAPNNNHSWRARPLVHNMFPNASNRIILARRDTADWRYRWHRRTNPVQVFIQPEVLLAKPDGTAPGFMSATVPGVPLWSIEDAATAQRPQDVVGINFFATDLPIGDDPYPAPGPAPVAGQHVLRISPTTVKMARPGYTVADTNDDRMIFSATKIPMKVAAAGTLTIAAGATATVVPKAPIDTTCLVDFYGEQSSQGMTIPPFASIFDEANMVAYRISGGNVQFRNDSTVSVTIVYVVFTDGVVPQSTGNAKIYEVMGEGHAVLRVPGTAGTSRRDEIINTKLSFLPIVKQGWVPYTDFVSSDSSIRGTHMALITWTNTGFKPYPIFVLKCVRRDDPTDIQYRYPNIGWLKATDPDRMSAESVYAEITDTQLKVFAWRGAFNPIYAQTAPYATTMDPYDCVGVRYYIFAIPNAL